MGCKDCPNQRKTKNGEPGIPEVIRPESPSTGWIVYTGGPPCLHLAMMQHTLPPNYKRARFHTDGSIEYEKGPDNWEPPSPIQGYERDQENQWLFRPLWESCQHRMYGTEIKDACECVQVVAVCSHPEVTLDDHGEVTFDKCKGCSKRLPIPEPLTPVNMPAPIRFAESARDQSAPSPQS